MARPVIHQIVSSDPQGTLPQFPRELDWESVPRSSSLLGCAPCPAFVGRRATPKALCQGANARASWNKWKGPTRVKRRWEGDRLCRERPLRLRRQRYGSHHGDRRHGVGWPTGNLAEETFSAVRHFSTEFPFVRCVNHSPYLGRLEVNEKTGNH